MVVHVAMEATCKQFISAVMTQHQDQVRVQFSCLWILWMGWRGNWGSKLESGINHIQPKLVHPLLHQPESKHRPASKRCRSPSHSSLLLQQQQHQTETCDDLGRFPERKPKEFISVANVAKFFCETRDFFFFLLSGGFSFSSTAACILTGRQQSSQNTKMIYSNICLLSCNIAFLFCVFVHFTNECSDQFPHETPLLSPTPFSIFLIWGNSSDTPKNVYFEQHYFDYFFFTRDKNNLKKKIVSLICGQKC